MANRIILEMLADTSGLLKGFDQAQKQVDKFMDASKAAGASLGSGVNRALESFAGLATGGATAAGVLAGGVVAATLAASAMTLAVAKSVEATDQLSQKTGIATQTLQGWSVIMAENSFEATALTVGMKTLSKQIVDAKDPASAAAVSFEQMGINIRTLGSTEDVIRALADRFKGMADGPEKAAEAVRLFGKSGLDMIPILNRGAAAFDESRVAAEKFGLVLSSDQVSALNAADDASDRLGMALQGLKTAFALAFADATTSSIHAITAAIVTLKNMIATLTGSMKTPGDPGSGSNVQELLGQNITEELIKNWKDYEQGREEMEEHLGTLIRNRGIEEFKGIEAQKRAEEALGHTMIQIFQREEKERESVKHAEEELGKVVMQIIKRESEARNQAFAQQVMEAERIQSIQEGLGQGNMPSGGAFLDSIEQKERAYRNLSQLFVGVHREEAAIIAGNQEAAGLKIVQDSIYAWDHRNDAMDNALTIAKAVDGAQQALYASEQGAIGASDAARRVRFTLIDEEAARERTRIQETIFNEKEKNAALVALDLQTEARRRNAIQSFPSFFEQQMQAIVNSNSFSVSQIVTSWTSGIANAVVQGKSFASVMKSVWQQTQITVLQGFLNAGTQKIAQMGLFASQELGLIAATEATKTAETAAGSAARTAITTAEAGAEVGIMAGAQTAILGFFAAVSGALKALFLETLVPAVVAAGEFIMGVLMAIAEAMTATIFGIPAAIGILAGVAAIGVAIAAGVGAFAAGGIVTGPTLGLIGEAGSSEAVIPLNERGASFFRSVMGAGTGEHTTNVYLDGRLISRHVERGIRRDVGLMGGLG